ncbi:MAG: hypothetical protein ACRCV1_07845, partial [Leuconostoc mesenteroides]
MASDANTSSWKTTVIISTSPQVGFPCLRWMTIMLAVSSGCYSFEENIVFLFLILLIYLLTEACLFMRLSAYFV